MKYFALIFLFVSFEIQALEAVVTVLETPMLKYNDHGAPVVQYLRKGDVIKIHPSLANNKNYDHLAPSPEKIKKVQAEINQAAKWKQDPLFQEDHVVISPDDELIPTLDRQGNKVFVIRNHLYIYFENEKEFTQTVLPVDPTDYRLEEPLPKRYPLTSPTGYRGQFILGVTQPYYESYPYDSNVKTKSYMSPIEINATFLRQSPNDNQDRFYFGGTFNVKSFTNSYSFFNGREATEDGLKVGIGPYITYDAFKGEKNRVNLYLSINVNLFNQLRITQKNAIKETDERVYRAINIAPRIGVQYHRKSILEEIDFVAGSMMELEPVTTFKSTSAASRPTWWNEGGSDSFKTRTVFTMAAYIGFQSAY